MISFKDFTLHVLPGEHISINDQSFFVHNKNSFLLVSCLSQRLTLVQEILLQKCFFS